MLGRHIQYIYNEGMYELDTASQIDWVGGSPVIISDMGGSVPSYGPPYDYSFLPYVKVSGAGADMITNLKNLLGIVQHNRKTNEFTNKVAVIRKPAIVTVFKGKARMKEFQQAEEYFPFGYSEDDAIHPVYLEAGEQIVSGDLLIPFKATINGKDYSVWAKATAIRLGVPVNTTQVFSLPIRVQSVYPSPATSDNLNDCIFVLEFDDFTLKITG